MPVYACVHCSRLFLHEGQTHTVLRGLRGIHECGAVRVIVVKIRYIEFLLVT